MLLCKKIGLALLIFASNMEAALPPLYASIAEIKAILDSETLSKQLGGAEPIERIQRIENGFVVFSSTKYVEVDVIHENQLMPGPIKFNLNFHEVVSLTD